MGITSAIVLFAVIWWMTFFVVLPLRLKTQGEAGDVVPGTPQSAPENPQLKRKVRLTTIWAAILWAIIASIIVFEVITVQDFDVMGRMPAQSSE
ncbi:MAG: DUF1467 family protein [Mangrovicoccus sp.]